MTSFSKVSMVCSIMSNETSKHPENKIFWAKQKVNECKSTNLGFLFSMKKDVLTCQRASGRS